MAHKQYSLHAVQNTVVSVSIIWTSHLEMSNLLGLYIQFNFHQQNWKEYLDFPCPDWDPAETVWCFPNAFLGGRSTQIFHNKWKYQQRAVEK